MLGPTDQLPSGASQLSRWCEAGRGPRQRAAQTSSDCELGAFLFPRLLLSPSAPSISPLLIHLLGSFFFPSYPHVSLAFLISLLFNHLSLFPLFFFSSSLASAMQLDAGPFRAAVLIREGPEVLSWYEVVLAGWSWGEAGTPCSW